jgi:hypothetical protein
VNAHLSVKMERPVRKVFQVVLDTNVLVTALRSRRGAAHRVLRLVVTLAGRSTHPHRSFWSMRIC